MLQEAMLEVKLKICPEVNYKSLKDSVENTGKSNWNIIAQFTTQFHKPDIRPKLGHTFLSRTASSQGSQYLKLFLLAPVRQADVVVVFHGKIKLF